MRPRFEPTFGPVTAMSGPSPLKKRGARFLMPFLIEVTGYELTYSSLVLLGSAPIAGELAGHESNSQGDVRGLGATSSDPMSRD